MLTNLRSIFLYSILGLLLAEGGIKVIEQTGLFLAIIFTVVLIDVNTAYDIHKEMKENDE